MAFFQIEIYSSGSGINRVYDDISDRLLLSKSSQLEEYIDETEWDIFTFRPGNMTLVLDNKNHLFSKDSGRYDLASANNEIDVYWKENKSDSNSNRILLLKGEVNSETITENVINRTVEFKINSPIFDMVKSEAPTDIFVSLFDPARHVYLHDLFILTPFPSPHDPFFDSSYRPEIPTNVYRTKRSFWNAFMNYNEVSRQQKGIDLCKVLGVIPYYNYRNGRSELREREPDLSIAAAHHFSDDVLKVLRFETGNKMIYNRVSGNSNNGFNSSESRNEVFSNSNGDNRQLDINNNIVGFIEGTGSFAGTYPRLDYYWDSYKIVRPVFHIETEMNRQTLSVYPYDTVTLDQSIIQAELSRFGTAVFGQSVFESSSFFDTISGRFKVYGRKLNLKQQKIVFLLRKGV